jgi:hypothetical protein
MNLQESEFTVRLIRGADPLNRADDNVDAEVILKNGDRYVATFFTLKNIESLMKKYRDTGECNRGQYFWAADLVVVSEITEEIVHDTIADLIRTGEFTKAFSGPFPS